MDLELSETSYEIARKFRPQLGGIDQGEMKDEPGPIGFKALSEGHSGNNLSRYTVGFLHRVGKRGRRPVQQALKSVIIRHISDSDHIAQLYTATLATT